MHIHQQSHKQHHKHHPSQNMRANNIEAEIRQEDQTQAFSDVELICDLRVNFRVVVML